LQRHGLNFSESILSRLQASIKQSETLQQFSVCDYQLLSEKENSSHEAQEVQVHQAPEDTARRGAKPVE
jgi:hypothetical protein